jgi:hypothetical protein
MQAFSSKFQAIVVGMKTHKKEPVFKIENAEILCEESVQLLGIDIDSKINSECYISNICRKAAQKLNVLREKKNGVFLSKTNLLYFTILFYPILNFALWHGITAIKAVHKNGAYPRKGTKNYS